MVTANIDPLMAVDIPHGWDLIPLGKCVSGKLSYGVNAPAIPYNRCHPCYIRITDITEDGQYDDSDKKSVAITSEEEAMYSLKVGDIVLARTGASTGKSYLYSEKDGILVYAGFLIKAAVDMQSHNPRFIFGQLRTRRYWNWVAATSMRSGQPGINGKEYAAFLIPIAPKKEQDKISETLSAFDTYIDNLAELIEKKRGIRDGALEELVNGTFAIDGQGLQWNEVELGEVAFYKKERVVSERSKYVSTENMNQNYMGIEPYQGHDKVLGCQFDRTDTLMANIRPYLRKIWFADFSGCCSADVLVIKSKAGMNALLLYYLLANDRFVNYVMSGGVKGIKMPRGDKEYIMHYSVLVPIDEAKQTIIANAIAAMDEEIEALEAERDKMIQIREGAMDDLLTGRVRLSV